MTPTTPRFQWLDASRGIALVAMTIYHLCWNLEMFGYLPAGSAGSGALKLFARTIASSFLVLVGISLVLAHGRHIRWQAFWKRWRWIAAASLIITIATYFATPGAFIYFGILHHIALASLIGLAFLRLPWPAIALTIAALWFIDQAIALPAFDTRWLAWTGLYDIPPRSNDFVPLLPWFAAVLAGMIIGKMVLRKSETLGDIAATKPVKPLIFIGRHSLTYYLVHQPVLIALVYGVSLIAPPAIDIPQLRSEVLGACLQTCLDTNDGAFCSTYCDCAVDEMVARDVLVDNGQNQTLIDSTMAAIANQCKQQAMEPATQ